MSASDSAKSRMERVLRLHEQIDTLKLDIRQVYAEEKADGGDKTAMGAAVSYIRKRDKEGSDLADREAMADVYVAVYDAPRAHTHAREASYSEAKGRGSGLGNSEGQFDPETGELTDNQESVGPASAFTSSAAYEADENARTNSNQREVMSHAAVEAATETASRSFVSTDLSNPRPTPPADIPPASDVATREAGAQIAAASRLSSDDEPFQPPAFLERDYSDPGPIPDWMDRRAKREVVEA